MSVNKLYHTWFEKIQQLRPQERVTRLRNFAWLAVGILLSRSVHLSYIAEKLPGQARIVSKTRRISRFLDNSAVKVRDWYESVARDILEQVVNHGLEVRLLTDGSKVGFGHQLLMVAIAYRRRAIPIAWTWVKGARGHSSAHKQMALLHYIQGLIPDEAQVTLMGDSEFGAVPLLKQLESWKWGYVLRQKGSTRIKFPDQNHWWNLVSLANRDDPPQWLPDVRLTRKHGHKVNIIICWQAGQDEPWLLATNLSSLRDGLRAYKRRMWIEEMFGDFKKHGFDLESSQLRHFLRLSRLTLIVAFLYYWLVAFGSQVIKRGLRYLVDRADRRDLSIFRIGLRMFEWLQSNDEPIPIRLKR
jgi:hypothetical protein